MIIEVEKNFDLNPGDKERLVAGAKLIAKKTFTDVYYDAADFRLTTKDYWLRQREGKWELKVPLGETIHKKETDQYREFEGEEEIKKIIGPDWGRLKPLARIVTIRESWQKGEFHLDFDEMDFGYTTFEAEIMIEDENDVHAAEKKIMGFARENGIASAPGAGKVIVFIQRNNLAHYQALLRAGVVRAIGRPIPILPPPCIFLGPLLIGIGINILYPLSIFSISLRWRFFIFVILLASGGAFLYWAVKTLFRSKVDPRFKPVGGVVTGGPFSFTRNPMYISFTLIYLAVTVAFNALWAVLFLPIIFYTLHYGVILREEKYLEATLGENYLKYKARVRRWL